LRVSVIVVSHNTKELLRRCLASLPDDCEVVVVDNASTDGSAEMVRKDFPRVRLIKNPRNRGFGAANNQGMDVMTGEVALFLNSDAWATPGAVAELCKVMESGAVACGGRLVDSPAGLSLGQVQSSCASELTLWAVFCEQTGLEKLFPNNRFLSPYWTTHRLLAQDPARPHRVAQVMGACLMARPLERFDERFFLYVEDTDLCRRLRAHGPICYVPSAVFGHALGASGERWLSVARYNAGKELYFRIHHGPLSSWLCLALDRLGALGRWLFWSLGSLFTFGARPEFRARAALFWRVLWAPVQPDR
jgi:GT2 family glycosyltransferase